jgi:hypothetical protein
MSSHNWWVAGESVGEIHLSELEVAVALGLGVARVGSAAGECGGVFGPYSDANEVCGHLRQPGQKLDHAEHDRWRAEVLSSKNRVERHPVEYPLQCLSNHGGKRAASADRRQVAAAASRCGAWVLTGGVTGISPPAAAPVHSDDESNVTDVHRQTSTRKSSEPAGLRQRQELSAVIVRSLKWVATQ